MSISPDMTTAKSIESVRWLRAATPGPKLTTRNTMPLSSVVPTSRMQVSTSLSLFTGKPSVVQMFAEKALARPDFTFLTCSSISTRALPSGWWPVMTRRSLMVMELSLPVGKIAGEPVLDDVGDPAVVLAEHEMVDTADDVQVAVVAGALEQVE